MNVSKKQRKVNLLASQKLDLRSRKGTKKTKKTTSTKWYIIVLLHLYISMKKLIQIVYHFFKSKPKFTYILSLLTISIICIKSGVYFVDIYSEKILPTQVQIETDNKAITNELYIEISKEIEKSRQNKEKRSDFIAKINSILSSTDLIDQYWIRLGLDGKLQINAIMQIPILLIEAKNGERYVISNNMKIIAKNPLPNEYTSLLKLDAPELKINWKSKNTNTKIKKNKKLENNNLNETNTPVNFIWLLTQTKFINSEMLKLGKGYSLSKISWDSNTGFTLKINRNNSLLNNKIPDKNAEKPKTDSQNNSTLEKQDSDYLIALVGENNIKDKLERLKIILKELGNKNILPNKVDLDFTDKASFKIQGATSKLSQ